MTLKRQLFIASLLMLLIPWAGLQFVLELDQALREQAVEQLRHQAQRMQPVTRQFLAGQASVVAAQPVIYADIINRPLNLDGYSGDWPVYGHQDPRPYWQSLAPAADGTRLQWMAVADARYLYLMLRTNRAAPAFFNPAEPSQPHDQFTLSWQQNGETRRRMVRNSGPGRVSGVIPGSGNQPDRLITGYWQTTGQQLELRLPRPEAGSRVGIELTWPATGGNRVHWLGTGSAESTLLPLITREPELEGVLATLLNPGQQARVLEPGGWVRARAERPAAQGRPEFDSLTTLQIIEQISLNGLRALVRFYQPEPIPVDPDRPQTSTDNLPHEALVQHPDGDNLLMIRQNLDEDRMLILEESLDQLLTLSGTTLGAVITRSALLILGLMLVLLGYASWLSWRITRLQRAVTASVDDDGRILRPLQPAKAGDELGDLSRQFSQLVDRLQGYTGYLESFSRRLSHELKTPVAVVRSSLDNLRHASTEEERNNYIQRANSATDRLSQILQGMSEAARLEQALDHAEKETFDLADVLVQTTAAYQSLDPEHRIHYQGPTSETPLHGSPELLVQLLDKLVDNARDFTPVGGQIEVALKTRGPVLELSVFNAGSTLPEHLTSEIFSPFVSLRENQTSAPGEGHLGQGLLIVRLIAEHHGGSVQAKNETGGVRFVVSLPRR